MFFKDGSQVRLIRIAKYFGDSGRVIFSVLYNLDGFEQT